MTPDIVIRDADLDDLDAIGQLNRGAVPAVSDVDDRGLWRLIEKSSSTLVATDPDTGGVVAFLIALGPLADYDSPNYRFFADRYASFRYIDRVVVDTLHARRGIGARLYDTLEASARADGVGVLTAEVNVRPLNAESLAFHAARGFSVVGEQETQAGTTRVRLLVRELT